MAKPISFEKLGFRLVASGDEPRAAPEPETPFRVLLIGDFSGRTNRSVFDSVSALIGQRPLLVDRDNCDEVLAKLDVKIHLPVAGDQAPPVAIRFTELDDFHPDRLFEKIDVFKALRRTRRRLDDPRTFEAAASEVRSWFEREAAPVSHETTPAKLTSAPKLPEYTSEGLLDQVLDETQGKAPDVGRSADSSEWSAFLRKIVKPHLVPDPDPQHEEIVAAVDASIAKLMRTILHHPDFQAIEAAWRAVHFLVSRLETDTRLKLYLLDLSKGELAADLASSEDLQSTAMYRLLAEQTVETFGGDPWAAVAGNYTFDQTREDAELLGRMAKIASRAGAPFISAADARLLGCESLLETPHPKDWRRAVDQETSDVWNSLRRLPEASYLGLALPRFLLRLPYGEDTDPLDLFEFEEMPSDANHGHYLWGNPCFACVFLLGQAFSRYGWDLRPGVIQDIESLPLHVYQEQGESRIKPCAEILLTERSATAILDKGIMVFLSFRDLDIIRLARFQSFADPLTTLAGPWS